MTELERVLAQYERYIRGLALKLAPSPGLAEDVAQEVFVEILSHPDRWDLSRDPKALFAGITRNVAHRYWRNRMRNASRDLRQLADHIRELAAERDVEWFSDEERLALRKCLDRLPSRSRKLVDLFYCVGLKSHEIGEQLEVTSSTVRTSILRIRDKLQSCVRHTLSMKREALDGA